LFYIGIDPGLKGAWACLDEHGCLVDLGDLQARQSRLDCGALTRSLVELQKSSGVGHAVIEHAQSFAGEGHKGAFTFGHCLGAIEGVLSGLGFAVAKIKPLTWKTAMGLKGAGKNGSTERAKALYPGVQVDRHDVAEALLLARFAWLQRNNEHFWRG